MKIICLTQRPIQTLVLIYLFVNIFGFLSQLSIQRACKRFPALTKEGPEIPPRTFPARFKLWWQEIQLNVRSNSYFIFAFCPFVKGSRWLIFYGRSRSINSINSWVICPASFLESARCLWLSACVPFRKSGSPVPPALLMVTGFWRYCFSQEAWNLFPA